MIHDDTTNPQVSLQLLDAVMAQKVAAVLGPASVAGCRAAEPLVRQGPLIFCLSGGYHPDAGSYVFAGNVSTIDTAGAAIEYFVKRGIKRIVTITSADANGQDADAAINAGLAAMAAQSLIVDREHFAPSDISVSAQVARIKAASPQLVIAWTTGTLLGVDATAAQLRESLAQTKGWVGVKGTYDFRRVPQRGVSQDAVVVARCDGSKDRWIPVSRLGGAPL